jgi:sugar lactone lactonase YvrE
MTASGEGHFDAINQKIGELIAAFKAQGKLDSRPLHFALEKSKIAASTLSFPGKITADQATKRLFISDSGHNRIVIVDSANGKVLDVIGSGAEGAADGAFATASFHHPQGLVYADDKLYIADTENHKIRLADLKTKTVSTIAGTGSQAAFRAGGGTALSTALNSPWDLVLIGKKLYIAMAGAHQLWCLDFSDGTVKPYAGNGRENIADGSFDDASLAQPSGLTTDGTKLYFADSEVSAVRSADLAAGGKVATIIGKGLFDFGDVDGTPPKARLQHPLGVLWYNGKLYVADSYNHKIKIVDLKSGSVSSYLGDGKAGDQDGQSPKFSEPAGLTAIGNTLYIADTNNSKIRTVDLTTNTVGTLPIEDTKSAKAEQGPQTKAAEEDDQHVADQPNGERISVPEHKLQANAVGKLNITIDLPKGSHLNTEAPCSYKVTQRGDALLIPADKLSATLRHPSLTYTIPFKTSNAPKKAKVNISIPVYFCDDDRPGATCKIRHLYITIPVDIDAKSQASDLTITCPVKSTER